MMRGADWLIAAALCAIAAHARVPVEDLRPLLYTALAKGRAEGVLIGPVAVALSQSFATDAPLRVDVELLEPVSAHCARLRITSAQARVRGSDQQVTDRRFSYQLKFCADGRVNESARPTELVE